MLYSKQNWYCNSCGKLQISDLVNQYFGGKFLGFACCSKECVDEIRWKQTLSIMGSEYYPAGQMSSVIENGKAQQISMEE